MHKREKIFPGQRILIDLCNEWDLSTLPPDNIPPRAGDHIQTRLLEILHGAEESILIIFYWDHLKTELIERLLSLKKEVKVEIITDGWAGPLPDQINVVVKAPPTMTPKETGTDWLAGSVFIIDQRVAMVVMGSEDKGFTALYSESVGFVRLFTMYWNFFSNWG
jgi:hypothetical protein